MSSENPVEHSRRLRDAASWISAALLYASMSAILLQRTNSIHISSAPLDGLVVLTAAAATVFSAARRLPLQNVLLAGAVVAVCGSLTGLLAVRAGVWEFAPAAGLQLLGILPWWIPCLWLVTILASRGVALYVLGGRRQSSHFGLEVLALTIGLSLMLQAGVSHFVREGGYDHSSPGGTLATLVIYLVATALILCLITPILINKKPAASSPDFHPLLLWLPLALLVLAKTRW